MYCLLAFLPYTFYFLIKAPAYAWMPWFVHHQAGLFWAAAAAIVVANWVLQDAEKTPAPNMPRAIARSTIAWLRTDASFWGGVAALFAAGVYLTLRPFLPRLEDNRAAYWWSLAALVPMVAIFSWRPRSRSVDGGSDTAENRPFAYSGALLAAAVISAVYAVGARIHLYRVSGSLTLHWTDAEFTLWTVLSHFLLALLVLSVVNLIFVLALKTSRPQAARRGAIGLLLAAGLWSVLAHYLEDALSFRGWEALLFAASLAAAVTLLGFSMVLPFLDARGDAEPSPTSHSRLGIWIVLGASAVLAVVVPYLIGGADWSGFFHGAVTFAIWIVMSVCVFRLWRRRVSYSIVTVIAVLAGSAAAYKALETSEIFWSRPLGSTDDEISLSLEAYAGHDGSFQLVHHILSNTRGQACGDLCRILREYTNIRDTQARADVQLVDHLVPAQNERPNIFVFVIDSMRPDYLGAYNPQVDYTPNLDALARDGIVMHNVYTQYAGTSLSEPAIWAGAMMLHAHYLQPFERLNSLDRMLHADGYRMIVSYDEVLRVILPGDDDVVKLDTDKKLWNEFELGSTLQQAEAALDAGKDDARTNQSQPVFFYAQPKNVHQFARNHVPSPQSQNWKAPAGMNWRISYEVHWVDQCLGRFFDYLKQRGMYDNSIIIVTSDHGDATGELGRTSHSLTIWP